MCEITHEKCAVSHIFYVRPYACLLYTSHQAFRNGAVRVILEDAGGRLREGQQYGFYRIEAREENGIRQMVAVYDPAEGCDE